MPYLIGTVPATLNWVRNGMPLSRWSQYSSRFGFQFSSHDCETVRSLLPPPNSEIPNGSRALKLYSKPL